MDDNNYKWITIVLVIWAVVVSFVLSIHNIAVSESNRKLSTLKSRIAKQDSLVNEFRYDLQLLQDDVEELK